MEKLKNHQKQFLPDIDAKELLLRMSDGLVVFDKDFKYIFVSEKAKALHRKDFDMVGKYVWDVWPDLVGTQTQEIYEKAMKERIPIVFEQYYEPYKEWYERRIYPMEDGGLAVFFINITAKKQSETDWLKNHNQLEELVKRNAKALSESERRLNKAQEIAHLGSWEMDLEKEKLVWSDEAYRIFGYEPGGISPTYEIFLDIVHPEDRSMVDAAYFRSVGSGKNSYDIEHRIIKKSTGQIRYLHEKCEHIRDESGKVTRSVGMVHDVTERKKFEERLRVLSRAVDQSPVSIVITNIKGEIEYVNPKFSQLTGYSFYEVLGKNPRILKSGYTKPEEYARMWKNLLSGKEWRGELYNKKKNGELYWELASISPVKNSKGEIVNFVAVKEDISKIKESQKKLKKYAQKISEEKAKDEALIASIGNGIIAVDKNEKILFVNKKMSHFLNNRETAQGSKITGVLNLYNEDGRMLSKAERPITLALKGKNNELKNAYCVVKSKKIYVSVIASPVILGGEIIGAVASYTDVTKERQIEKAKTEFVSLASHQLRTPITEISLATEMLLAGVGGKVAGSQRRYLNNIRGGVKEITVLVEALLNITRIQMGNFVVNPKPVKIQDFMDRLLAGFSMQIKKKNLLLKKNYPKKPLELNIDSHIMQIIIENLVSNAVKYTEKGRISITIQKKEKQAVFIISDSGCGIPESQKHLVFTKLFRADNLLKNKTKGHGLGLHIVKSIVKKVGGNIKFESKEGKGTTFYVSLPLTGMKKKVQQNLI